MSARDQVNILLVDDQPAKLLSYEVILQDIGDTTLLKAASAREALEILLKNDVAVILVDVVMPDLDGFQLASMIHDHPRFQKTAIIFISAIQVTDVDRLRGYESGGVDYVPVPVIPEVLRAKVRVFVELYRKTRELERLNRELEQRVEERTAELQAAAARLTQSEQRRTLALAAGNMGSWDWDLVTNECVWDDGQYRICGLSPDERRPGAEALEGLIHPSDRETWRQSLEEARNSGLSPTIEFRLLRPTGETRWCIGAATATLDSSARPVHLNGVTVDITERKEAEQRQALLAREVDHRSRNALAVVQSILRLSRAPTIREYVSAVDGRIQALSIAHGLLSESRWHGADLMRIVEQEFAPFRASANPVAAQGPNVLLRPASAQTIALALHELVTNAAKYGALSLPKGKVTLTWCMEDGHLLLDWIERGGPDVAPPTKQGFGATIIRANVESSLDGAVEFRWLPEGLHCHIRIPESNLASHETGRPSGNGAARPAAPAPSLDAMRILLVEDETMVALAMQAMLQELGYHVIGPARRNAEALSLLAAEPIDGAILDLNIDGEPVYPVAEELIMQHIPFIMVTGYDADSIDPRYRSAPTLQKPVESQSLGRLLQVMFKVHPPSRVRPPMQAAAPNAS